MFVSAIAALALGTLDTHAKPKITAVSMFKNGFSFVSRRTDIPSSGEYIIDQPPMAAHGTFWHLPSDGIAITGTSATTLEETSTRSVASIDELIAANAGKQVTVDFTDLPSLTGTIMQSIGDQLVLKTNEGIVFAMRARIKRLIFQQEPQIKEPTKTSKRVMKLVVDAKNPGAIDTIGLEHGLSWVPAYAIDITDPKELTLVAKATVINELEDLDNADASFITGFPNTQYAGLVDPLVNPAAMDDFLSMLIGGGFQRQNFNSMANQMAAAPSMQAEKDMRDFTAGFLPLGTGEQLEDLFFYRLTGITLKKGDRASYTLFKTTTPYQHLYTWDVVRTGYINQYSDVNSYRSPDQTIWHTLVFKNNSGKPLTTGVASTFEKGQLLGQDVMKYAPANGDAELHITKTLDIQPDTLEEEVGRERAALQLPGGSTYDLITVKGTVTAKNLMASTIKMRITLSFDGDLVSADGSPDVRKNSKGLGSINPSTALRWTPDVKSGETVKRTYTYKLYVHTP